MTDDTHRMIKKFYDGEDIECVFRQCLEEYKQASAEKREDSFKHGYMVAAYKMKEIIENMKPISGTEAFGAEIKKMVENFSKDTEHGLMLYMHENGRR